MLTKTIRSTTSSRRTTYQEKTDDYVNIIDDEDDTLSDYEEDFQPTKSSTRKRAIVESEEEEEDYIENDDNDDENDSDFSDKEVAPRSKKKNQHIDKKPKILLRGVLKGPRPKALIPVSRPSKGFDPETDDSNFGERRTLGLRRRPGHLLRALYDHTAEGAIVLWDPDNQPAKEELKITTDNPPPKKKEKSISEILGIKKEKTKFVHVVVDPALSKVLRPHQVEGVRFLYECTTGQIHPSAFGCIMADEMGLGKTLQCIALVWTLLQQSGELGKPTIHKAIITCPSSLVRNWANEFVKWLGESRVQPLVMDKANASSKEKIAEIKRWGAKQGKMTNPILIISYESLRAYSKYLNKSPIGLFVQ